MPGFCNTLPTIVIIGGAFTIVAIVLLALGGSTDSYICGATCQASCPNNYFYTSQDGDLRCSDCIFYDGECKTISVTKQIHAVYSSLTGIGALMLGLAVLVSFVKLLKLLQKVTIDTSKRNNITLILFLVFLVLGVMFFVIRVNAPGIACQTVCNPVCATKSGRYRALGWYGIIDYDGKQIDCIECIVGTSAFCNSVTVTSEALIVAQAGLGLGIPFTVIGGIFGVLWLVKAVVLPTKNGTPKPSNNQKA